MSKIPLALIAAQASNRVIGVNNQMPWHVPEDFKYFKRVTMGKPVLMGRKTFESIGRPLPGRKNIVITRQSSWTADGVVVCHSLAEAVSLAEQETPEEIMIIGGAQIYEEALPLVDTIYLTRIDRAFDGDAWFPVITGQWQENVAEQGVSEKQKLPYRCCVLHRVTKG